MSFMPMPRGHVLPYSPDYYRIQQEQTAPRRPCSRIGSAHSTAIVTVERGGRCGAPEAQRQPGPPEVGGESGCNAEPQGARIPNDTERPASTCAAKPSACNVAPKETTERAATAACGGGGTIMKGTRERGGPRSASVLIVVAKGNSCKRSGWLVGSCPPPCRPHHVTPHTHPWCHPWWAGAGAGRVWGWGAQGQRAAAPQGCTCGAEHGCGSEGWVRRRVIQRGKADRPRPALYVRSLPPTPARTGQHGQLQCI